MKYLDQMDFMIMKKSDKILITIVIIVSLITIIILKITKTDSNSAIVYYNDLPILNINLNEKKEYTVKGDLGDIIIETGIGKIRVKKENSPKHLCSKQGWVSNNYTPIICLPNKIVIKINNKKDNVDTVVR